MVEQNSLRHFLLLACDASRGALFDELGLSTLDAAASLLLGSQFEPDEEGSSSGDWHTVTEADGASFARLEPAAHVSAAEKFSDAEEASAHFASFETYELPDNPPVRGAPPTTRCHKFTLRAEGARVINARLRASAATLIAAAARADGTADGVRVSNVGGFHSREVPLSRDVVDGADAADDAMWCGSELHDALRAALARVECCPRAGSGRARLRLTGWLNASPPTAFNALHDHGTAAWSFVYFGAAGDETADPDEAADEAAPAFEGRGGSLLLMTQLEPRTRRHAYLPIAPVPGELWAFPGYVPHAVLPRALRDRRDSLCSASSPSRARRSWGGLRVSIACNATAIDDEVDENSYS